MNKFTRNISQTSNETLKSRGMLLGQQTANEQTALIQELEGKVINIRLDIIKSSDLAPESSMSTKPMDINPREWVRNLHAKKVELALLEEELKIAKETQAEWFTEEDLPNANIGTTKSVSQAPGFNEERANTPGEQEGLQ